MNVVRRVPTMTLEEFLPWAEAQDARYEFDGFAPVAMGGGNVRHSQIGANAVSALASRLKAPCRVLGPDAGLRTVGDAMRYPDALITCSKVNDLSYEVSGVVIAFEVISPTSGYVDRIVKLSEYRAVASMRRYIIVESASAAVIVFARDAAEADWMATALTASETLALPEVGIEFPVAALYVGTDLEGEPPAG
jgi:Uma2 family endonuclease